VQGACRHFLFVFTTSKTHLAAKEAKDHLKDPMKLNGMKSDIQHN
jgi:hypothetical protein